MPTSYDPDLEVDFSILFGEEQPASEQIEQVFVEFPAG